MAGLSARTRFSPNSGPNRRARLGGRRYERFVAIPIVRATGSLEAKAIAAVMHGFRA
jgi:hypothetical protein